MVLNLVGGATASRRRGHVCRLHNYTRKINCVGLLRVTIYGLSSGEATAEVSFLGIPTSVVLVIEIYFYFSTSCQHYHGFLLSNFYLHRFKKVLLELLFSPLCTEYNSD